ncbi:5-hydroxytryptamine receptor 3A-like, partial [Larimichthys crocea]|uniref:5-hydroxytryptamine receptor 3A-like n=1 Tax=Larimichthys crocea TaxID=215358 RepID=UPI000F5F7AEE
SGRELMMLAGFLFLLLLTDGESSERICSYQDVLDYLNLTTNKDMLSLTRPVKNYKYATNVTLDVLLYGILDVVKKEQQLVPYAWIDMWWKNEFISWDPEEFCGIKNVSLPAEILWKPDITIQEMIENDKAPPSPYLSVQYNGEIILTNDKVLVSTCRMHVYKFPFDIQSCNLTFKSVIHTVDEILLVENYDSKRTTELTHTLIQTQYEWLFINMTVTNKTIDLFDFRQSVIIYTITMRRRSALYIVNFVLPILFFLCLDLASFLLSDSGAVYCIGIFSLMMLSLLETIVVIHLLNKDAASEENETDQDKSLSEVCEERQRKVCPRNCFRGAEKWICCACNVSSGKTTSELLSVKKFE